MKEEKKEGGFVFASFFIFFFFLFVFQTKFLNTGDAGELVAASYSLGIAHPSGYPLYLMISKFFTFLPLGNIPTKVTLVSSVSSSFLMSLLIYFFIKETSSLKAGIFCVLLLFSTYSFFGQSLIAKFYPLNTLMIFLIFYLGYRSVSSYSLKNQLIISFLLGLSAGLHHTTFLILIPLLLLSFFHFKDFLRNLFPSVFLFLAGSTVVAYLMIRSMKVTLLNMSPSADFSSLIDTLSRKIYGSSSSVEVIKKGLSFSSERLFFASKNILLLLIKEFHLYSIIFFLSGILFLLKNKKKFTYTILTFITYSILLAYLTFCKKNPDIKDWYICAHQYFLPMLLFYAIISGFGFCFIKDFIPKNSSFLLILFPCIYLPNHIFVNFYDRNEVVHYKMIDQLFTKPIKSVLILEGDNDVFQGWYKKNIEKFRDDLCFITAPSIDKKIWCIRNGCIKEIYGRFFPEIFRHPNILNLYCLKDYMTEFRLYSTSPIEKNNSLKRHLISRYCIMDFVVMPKEALSEEKSLKDIRMKFKDVIHYEPCLRHFTDDLFTKAICKRYSTYLVYLSRDIGEGEKSSRRISNITITWRGKKETLSFPITKENITYMEIAKKIEQINKTFDFCLYEP